MIAEKGSGNIISKEFHVSSFIRLHIAAKGLTNLIQSEEEKVVVECDDNLLGSFEAMNYGRTLYISSDAKLRTPIFTDLKINVYYSSIDTLFVRCDGGNVTCENQMRLDNPLEIKIQSVGNTNLVIDVPTAKLTSQCVGDVTLSGKCGMLYIRNQSEGNLFAKELIANELAIKNMAAGNVTVSVQDAITISHHGEGYIHYYGKARLKDVKHYGNGIIKRFD